MYQAVMKLDMIFSVISDETISLDIANGSRYVLELG